MKKKILITTLIITALLLTASSILFMIKKENDTKKDLKEKVAEEKQLEEEKKEIEEEKEDEEISKSTTEEDGYRGWILTKDTNPGADCSEQVYEGRIPVRGYADYAENYGGEKDIFFRILDDDISQLPIKLKNPLVYIINFDEEKFLSFSKNNPATLIVIGFRIYCEGFAGLFIDNTMFDK